MLRPSLSIPTRSLIFAQALSVLVLLGSLPGPVFADAPAQSKLWGVHGELWERGGRLPDFSYAGYRRGEEPLPSRPAELSVVDFGARGDDDVDDTEAFQKAIDAAAGKVLHVPAGRYRITGLLTVRDSGTVIRGDGPDRSILYFPTPLNEIEPNWGATTTGRRTSNYSWSGGFLWFRGSPSRKELSRVTEPAQRGESALVVSDPSAFEKGQEVRLELRDTEENSLARHLYDGDPGPVENLRGRSREVLAARVEKVDVESRSVHLDRRLRTDVRPDWRPRLFPAASSVEECGVEELGFEFPVTPYKGHFTELGFNALAFSGVRNGWARNLRIANADSGIFVSGTQITIEGLVIESDREVESQRQATGHHGVTLGGQDNRLTDFEFRTRFMHDITVTRGSAGNVAERGRGIDLALDHHRYGPHSNLFTEIDLGEGSRMFQSGGGARLGRHSAARETFWGIRSRRPQSWPEGWGPDLMNIVGVPSEDPPVTDPHGRWFEPLDPRKLRPGNLYRAQLQRRLER